MNHQFEKLKERGNKLELRAFVQESSVEELMRLMRSSICKSDGIKVLDNLLQAFSDSEACQAKRRKLAEFTLKSLEKSNVSAGQANAIVNRIISDLPSYSKQQLVKFVDFCLTSIRNNDNELCSWKDLLPALLEALENEKYIVYADAEVSGTEYKSLIIKTICNYHWDVNLLPSLTKMFGDMVLDKADRNEVLKSLCSALPNLPLDQVPSFTYQALKLCPNRDNQKLLDALSKYFDLCYSKTSLCDDRDSFEDIGVINLKEVQDIESTVLYHVYQAAQLNHENMKDFIRFLKHVSHSEYMLQPFMFSVLMSVSGIYEDQIFEILRLAIVYNSLEKQKRQNSAWLRQILPTPSDIIGVIQQVIGSSNKDRHLVLRGLTNLAFTLMNDDQKSKNNAITTWHIGSEIIREIIKKHHETAPLILQELINKIIAGGVTTTHYIDCLKYMCRELSMIVLEHQVWIMTILERLLFLHPTVANQVLFAIFPLVRVSPNIRENLLLILRKALYRKGVSKRQMAVMGFLEMLKCTKMRSQLSFRLSQHSNSMISSSSRSTLTQATLEYNSQRERSVTDCDKTLYYEILDILKKTFTYEFEVRLYLYESLYATVTKNPEITEIVLNMLLSHLNLYLNTDDSVLPPVKLELCTDVHGVEVILQEPIAQLIFTLQKIYINSVVKNLHTSEKLHDILKSLCNKMAITELEHLNLEHETNLLHGDFPKSQIKLKNLGIAIGIYEALMAFRIGEWSKENKENFHDINNLFKAYTRLIDFSKTPSTKVKKGDGNRSKKDKDANNTTKKSGKSTNIKIPNTIMDLDVIRQSLSLLFSQSSTQSDAPRRNHSFCCYILQTCEQLLQHTKPFVQNTFQLQNHQYINTYIDIGRLLYKYFVQNLEDTLTDDEQVTILALQCFKEISCCICTLLSSELQTFLNSIFEVRSKKDSKSTNINFQLQKIIFSLNPYLKKFLTVETDNNEGKKISLLLLQIIEQFTYKINFEDYNSDQMLECMKEIIQMEDIQSSIVPTIIQFFLNLEEYSQEYGETLNEICIELCEKVGSIDKTELETNNLYKSIREDTILQIYNVLNGHIKQKLDNASWLLMRLKAEDAIARAPGTIDESWNNKLREKERNLCRQLSYIAQVLQTLANTSIKPGPSTDFTFKNLQYLYHLLGNLTKYFYAKSSSQNAAFQAVKFIQVVQLAGKPLKSTFYNLVTYVEENQNKLQSKSDSYAQRNKILKETKVIPRVVYEIEQFNKEILLLSKRTGVPLENYIKHSITRDFRIKNPQLVEGLEKMDVSLLISPNVENSESEIQTSNVNDSDSSNDDESSNKRPRIEDETVN